MHIAVSHVGELVGQHALELLDVEASRMPVVTHTTARLGERPVANALGMSVSAIATRGFGMSAIAQSRSISAVQLAAPPPA